MNGGYGRQQNFTVRALLPAPPGMYRLASAKRSPERRAHCRYRSSNARSSKAADSRLLRPFTPLRAIRSIRWVPAGMRAARFGDGLRTAMSQYVSEVAGAVHLVSGPPRQEHG